MADGLRSIIIRCSACRPVPRRRAWHAGAHPIDRERLTAFCWRHRIRKLALFGSVPRNDFRPDSDINVLVEFEPGRVSGFRILDLEAELS